MAFGDYNLKYLHAQRTDPRFQTVTNQAPTLKGEVPEKRYAPTEADLTDVFETAGAFLNAHNRRLAAQGKTNNDYIQRYKNTILSDYAAQDMKLVMQGQQNEIDPSELALQRNLLKQQYLQVAPSYLTQADFNKQAKANFNLDVGAELYKNELDMAQTIRKKEYDQAQTNALNYMKEQYPDEYQAIHPSQYQSMMANDMREVNNLEATAAQAMLVASNPSSTDDDREDAEAQVAAAAEPVMESQMFKGLMDAWREIGNDGVVEDKEIEYFKKTMADAFASNYGYSYERAYRQAGRITNRWLGAQNRSYNASVAANLKSVQDMKNLQEAWQGYMTKLYAIKTQYGINIGDAAGPAQSLVFNRMSPGWLNKNGYDYRDLLSVAFGPQTQSIIAQAIENKGGETNIFSNLGSGQYVAGFIDLLNDPQYLKHLPPEQVERYQEMSRILAANNSKLFADMEKMTPAELATYWFRPGQVMSATTNSVTLPTGEEVDKESTGDGGVPGEKRDNALIWNHRHDAFVADGLYDSDAERVAQQEQYKINTESLMLPYLTSIKDSGAIDNLRYDPEKREYYQVVPTGGEKVNTLLAPGFLSDIEMLNGFLKQPNLVFKDVDGSTEIDMRTDITDALNKNYGVKEMTVEESLNLGERPYMYGGFVTGARDVITGLRNTEQGLEKTIKSNVGKDSAWEQSKLGTAGVFAGTLETIAGGISDLGEQAYNLGAALADKFKGAPKDTSVSPDDALRNYVKVGRDNTESVNYIAENYDAHNPTIPQTEFMMEPFTADGQSSINTISIGEDGYEVLIPTVVDGVQLSEQEAIDNYRKTGKHFGKYTSVKDADKMAEALHNAQEVTQAALEARKSYYEGYGNIPFPEFTDKENLKIFKDGGEYILGANTDTETAEDRYKHGTYIFKSPKEENVEKFKEGLEKQIDNKSLDVLLGDYGRNPDVVAITDEKGTDENGLVIEVNGAANNAQQSSSSSYSEVTPQANSTQRKALSSTVTDHSIPEDVMKEIPSVADALNVKEVDILDKLAAESSMGKQAGTSKAGAKGLMQVTPVAKEEVLKDKEIMKDIKDAYPNFKGNISDPLDNLILGAGYMKICEKIVDKKCAANGVRLSKKDKSDLVRVVYNHGTGSGLNKIIDTIKEHPKDWKERKPFSNYKNYLAMQDYKRFVK